MLRSRGRHAFTRPPSPYSAPSAVKHVDTKVSAHANINLRLNIPECHSPTKKVFDSGEPNTWRLSTVGELHARAHQAGVLNACVIVGLVLAACALTVRTTGFDCSAGTRSARAASTPSAIATGTHTRIAARADSHLGSRTTAARFAHTFGSRRAIAVVTGTRITTTTAAFGTRRTTTGGFTFRDTGGGNHTTHCQQSQTTKNQ